MAQIIPFPKAGRDKTVQSTQQIAGELPDNGLDDGPRWGLWMACAQAGDHAAYHRLLRDIAPYLRSLSRRYLGNEADTEDVVQEILIVVHDIRHTYEPQRPFKPWLKTIATRRCIDLLRRRTRRLQHEIANEQDWSQVEATEATPEQALEQRQQRRALGSAVHGLPARQREAIELLKIRELSLLEAAAHSEQSVGSLKVACHRAVKSLHRALSGKDQSHD